MTITHKLDFLIEDLSKNKEEEFLNRFISLVEEFNCLCGGSLMPYKEDDEDKSDEQTIEG